MSKYDEALFLYNGNAEYEEMQGKLMYAIPKLSLAIKQLHIVQTESIEDVKDVCVRYASKVDLLLILGGDGTVHACINAISPLKERPIVGILPGGTCNDFSRVLNIPQQLEKAASAIVEGHVVDIDVGKADDRYFLNFWGIGLIAETSQNIDPIQKKYLGVLSYFMSTLKTITQAKSFSYVITTDEQTVQGEAVMIVVLNGRYLGTQELPISRLQPDDGKLDVLIVKNSNLAFFRELFSMNDPDTKLKELNELMYIQTGRLRVTTDDRKEADMDGEIVTGTPTEVELLPKHLQMIRAK
ncbi:MULTISPECIES: YegS/Rv2252/BmrU family lipid kinase [Clostridia]|uniref:YegS/Rv2252/BmrU family lipid kinase n=1 Tax=Clostridia TaxID=186801 RepID=UPI000EA2163D|nr:MULTISPECIES: YegS/Rv2252/BmrU family lipid kinase [Clostridia]NBJ71214.1 YegS/Rv2252/BmrU family lipid kinase [Roseburia sp. 1XD42-34]RKI74957.1 YegS/Rv2252/BmrU family lipid kinase [Clostridium sp. 1xD42-85]